MSQVKNRKVTCVDIEGKKYQVDSSKLTFRPSVYGVILQDNKIFLSKQWDGYDFPGGGVELGETIEEALCREVKEETGLSVRVGRIVSCQHSFFKVPFAEDRFVHSILMYYLCDITGGEISTKYFDTHEKLYADKPEWLELSKIDSIKFYNSIDSRQIIKEAIILAKMSSEKLH